MVKKIVDIPEGADFIEVFYKSAGQMFTKVLDSETFVVSELADAPDKQTIELEANVLDTLIEIKDDTPNVYQFIDKVVTYNNDYHLETPKWTTVLDWYLGHVDFVAKKDKMWRVEVPQLRIGSDKHFVVFNETTTDVQFSPDIIDDHAPEWKDEFTESEADKLIAGLTALKPRKVKVEE